MSNILDYISWRGDLPFSSYKLNEIDKLILMRLSYLPFGNLGLKKDSTISIKNIMERMQHISEEYFIWADDKKLITLLGNSPRFKDLILSDFVEFSDKSLEKQFAAIIINLEENLKVVSFRGTDMSLIGWKEDFNMTFKNNVPSQIEGVYYLNEIGNKYKNSDFILLGHSKGGNIAMYASIYCIDYIKLNIREIVTADSPGLSEEILNDIKYNDIKNKIVSYIPQTSIVGRILELGNDYTVVQSSGKGFMQHDIYTWDIGPTFLIQIKDASKESDFANNVIKEYLNKTTPEDREKFINIVFEVLLSLEVETVTDIPKLLLKNTNKALKKYKNISKEDKLQVENMMKQIKDVIIENIKLEILPQNLINNSNTSTKDTYKLEEQKLLNSGEEILDEKDIKKKKKRNFFSKKEK